VFVIETELWLSLGYTTGVGYPNELIYARTINVCVDYICRIIAG